MWQLAIILCQTGTVWSIDASTLDLLTPLPELGEACGYASCPTTLPDALNVHIVPHTHGELGYTNSFYEHYTGLEGLVTARPYSFKNILDAVLTELWANEKRKFTISDLPYFYYWWQNRDATVHRMVYQLVRQGRMNFVGGSWGMPDESTTSYHAIIDLYTYALRKQNATFLSCGRPLVSWQADSFGHTREYASLVAQMGFTGHFINPISYDDELVRMTSKSLEFVWRGNDDLGPESDIFTHKLFDGYWSPPGFCFGESCEDPLIIIPDGGPEYAAKRVETFLKVIRDRQSKYYRTNHVLVIMGKRQGYYNAQTWFRNIEALMGHVNAKGLQMKNKFYMFYSTPACYLKSVYETRPKLPNKQDDFVPLTYDRQSHATGMYTSRPLIKYLAREIHRFSQMAKQMQVLAKLGNNDKRFEDIMWIAGVIQDHNVLSGAMRPHVTTYYYRKLDVAIQKATQIMKDGFNRLRKTPKQFSWIYTCQFNVSACPNLEGDWSYIIIYNPLAWPVTVPVRLPVGDANRLVYDNEGTYVEAVTMKIPELVLQIPRRISTAKHELVFLAQNLPPLGYSLVTKYDNLKRATAEFLLDLLGRAAFRTVGRWSYYLEKVTRKKRSVIKNLNKNNIKYLAHQAKRNSMNIEDITGPENENFANREATDRPTILFGNLTGMEKANGTDGYVVTPPVRVEATTTIAINNEITAPTLVDSDRTELPKMTTPEYDDDEFEDAETTTSKNMQLRKTIDENFHGEKSTDLFIKNEYIRVNLHSNRRVTSLELCTGVKISLNVEFFYYVSDDPEKFGESRPSPGAYIFRPMDPRPVAITESFTTEVHKSVLVEELHLKYSEYAMAVLRIYKDMPVVEVDWVVGPISVDDGLGKEVFVRYTTDLDSNGMFYTDSNGRQCLKRIRDARPTYEPDNVDSIPSNIYPVTSKIYIEDTARNLRFTVFNDRAQGGTSLSNGQIDLMLHRRILTDDDGVMTYLNETIDGKGLIVRGKHYIYLTKADYRPNRIFEKRFAKEIELSPYVFVSQHASYMEQNRKLWLKNVNEFAGIRKRLPLGVHVLTLEKWTNGLLLRLENYLESADLIRNGVKIVFIRNLFNGFNITGAKETLLSAHIWKDDFAPLEWRTDSFVKNFNSAYGNLSGIVYADDASRDVASVDLDKGIVLEPQQIRTFVVTYVKY